MNKLYVGNLPGEVNEGTLRELFTEHGIQCANILVKKGGYAFVDCVEQGSADKAIDKLNGSNFMGSTLLVEPSVPRGRRSRTNKVQVGNLGSHVNFDDLEKLMATFGQLLKFDPVEPKENTAEYSVVVTYETQDQAQQAVAQLNGYEYDSCNLRVDYVPEPGQALGGSQVGNSNSSTGRNQSRDSQSGGRSTGSRGRGGGRGGPMGGQGQQHMMGYGGGQMPVRPTDFPLRVLVLSEMVGAIIGRQGGTIRQITQQTRARVDVHRKDNAGSLEKAITIYGAPENCTNACKRILEVMEQEAQNTNKGEICLKILAHNNLIGRIIGKGGATIKRIMQDTESKITVSSIHDVNSFNLERTITVKGAVEAMSKAEAQISAKLRQSYDNDLQAMAPQSMMFPGLHPMAMMSTVGSNTYPPPPRMNGPGGPNQGLYGAGPGGVASYPNSMVPPPFTAQPPIQETVYLYIPNAAVGAIIGTKGTHIRNMIRFSGASVKIASVNKDEPVDHSTERKVTIVGTPEAQWKAQFLIFEKMREEGFAGTEDIRLKIEMSVPVTFVGRIIGKGGQNVRELQRATGSIIKLPEENSGPSPPPTPSERQPSSAPETVVHIIGSFYSVQSAQRRIRAMVSGGSFIGGGGGPQQGGVPNNEYQRRRGQRGDQN